MTVLATSGTTFWTIALIIGLVAALIVAVLLVILVNTVRRIEGSVDDLLTIAGGVGETREVLIKEIAAAFMVSTRMPAPN